MTKKYGIFIALLTLTACDQGDDRLMEKARIEGREQAKAEMQAKLDEKDKLIEMAYEEGKAAAQAGTEEQNRNLAEKAKEMEGDLSLRHLFYKSVGGVYEGSFRLGNTSSQEYRIRITLVPSLSPYQSNRVRQLDEISYDLSHLFFNAQVVMWNPENELSAVGCRVKEIHPDLVNGSVAIASSDCSNLYSFQIEEETQSQPDLENSKRLAALIREGKLDSISAIRGVIQPTTNARRFQFRAIRKEEN